MRGIYAYHVNGNGWCDIGYQFLVDRFGRLYEGRFGGDYKNVVGAQAQGFNMQSFGISSIANHDPDTAGAVAPSAAVLTAIGKLIGWKAWLNGFDPSTSVSYTSAGSTRWPEGTVITKPRVSGHRDFNLTTCPGDLMFSKLATDPHDRDDVVPRGRGRRDGRRDTGRGDLRQAHRHVDHAEWSRFRPRPGDEPVRRLRGRAERADQRRDHQLLLPRHDPVDRGRQPDGAGAAERDRHGRHPGRLHRRPHGDRRHAHHLARQEDRDGGAGHPVAGRALRHRPEPAVVRGWLEDPDRLVRPRGAGDVPEHHHGHRARRALRQRAARLPRHGAHPPGGHRPRTRSTSPPSSPTCRASSRPRCRPAGRRRPSRPRPWPRAPTCCG